MFGKQLNNDQSKWRFVVIMMGYAR